MGLFSKGPDLDDDDDDIEEEPIALYNNAPSHWPVIMTEPLIPDFVPGGDTMNITNFGAAMKQIFESSNCGCVLNGVLKTLLTPGGLLEIPIEVNDRGTLIPVFLFASADENSAASYYGSFGILRAKGYQDPVYYAPSPLPQVPPGRPPLRPFGAELLTRYQGQMPKGSYALLWADELTPNILTTECLKSIHRSFGALAGIESYVVASIFRALGLVESEVQRMKLPSKPMNIPVVGPENQAFILSVSEEKGVRFHFNPQLTPPEYRDAFWSVFAAYAEGWKNDAMKQKLELDYARGQPPSLRNWLNTVDLLYKQKQAVAEIGVLTI